MLTGENKNYRHLVGLAENAYRNQNYLEAFLIQSCVIEGVLKNYAKAKLSIFLTAVPSLRNKFDNLEVARLLDLLLIAKKITNGLYDNLNKYRKKRNEVVHKLLEFDDQEKLKDELREAYESGVHLKGFIVDDMSSQDSNIALVELQAEIIAHLRELVAAQENFQTAPLGVDINAQAVALLEQLQALHLKNS